jgi:hypothetical protein
MGRKPNPIILQYFDRGPKLEDASNRYQHSCKQCGEQFPKGRIDSLTNHLTKKCSAISLDERREVLLRLHNVGPAADSRAGATTTVQNGGNVTLPFSPSRQFDRLNVLAEASRQVGATNEPNRSGGYTTQPNGEGVVVDPALQNALQEEDFFNNQDYYTSRPGKSCLLSSLESGTRPARLWDAILQHLLWIVCTLQCWQINMLISHHTGNFPGTTAASLPSFTRSTDLLSIAVSANETLANVMPSDFGPGNDQDTTNFLSGINHYALGITPNPIFADSSITWPNPSQAPTHETLVDLSSEQKQNGEQRAASFPRPIAINPNSTTPGTALMPDFGLSGKPVQKSNVRKRFDPDRRKEVQKLRKIGACIRCRTLKKPCSDTTPCFTCQSIEGPRLWKEPCTRARLADSFSLYTVGLLGTLAYRDVSQVKATLQVATSTGNLEVSHFDDFHIKLNVASVQGQRVPAASMNGYSTPQHVVLVDRESNDFPKKLEDYLEALAPALFDQEQSHFMKVTLKLAAELSTSKQDLLLGRTLDLWTATQALSDLHLGWKIVTVQESASDSFRRPIDESNNPHSHALISGQLRGAIEKRAEQLSKFVMSKLEKRFIEPHKNNQFETFLIAIILLNCTERITWLFRTWDNEQSAARWPLEKGPDTYTTQGDGFSDVLHMLLRVRTLIPRTTSRPDNGILRTADKDSDKTATKWFEALSLTEQFLQSCLAAQFDATDSRSLDGKYFAKVLN